MPRSLRRSVRSGSVLARGLALPRGSWLQLDAGLKSPAWHTVAQAVKDWLRDGLDGHSERTRKLYAGLTRSLLEYVGSKPLRTMSAQDVRWH